MACCPGTMVKKTIIHAGRQLAGAKISWPTFPTVSASISKIELAEFNVVRNFKGFVKIITDSENL